VPIFDINSVGPHPGFIEPCQRHVFEHRISKDLQQLGTEGAKEDNFRIQGVIFIDQVRKSLGL
jgi:CTD kinase subunit beta